MMSTPSTAPRALVVSEPAFLKQAELIQKNLDAFKGISAVPNLGDALIRHALSDLIDATVRPLFISFFFSY